MFDSCTACRRCTTRTPTWAPSSTRSAASVPSRSLTKSSSQRRRSSLTRRRTACTRSRQSWSLLWREFEILIVAALGGNALLQRGEKPAAEIQQHHVVGAVEQLARICDGNEIIVTHGNGPQVGMLALESANDPVLDDPF